ncbi:hypothetical protein BC939DRAFT_525931 [Gamsiella multidivaricata]|uniref:uncharacterized protein n=1 Tax=Gamsiella multidivaricata TaxID=101098 RepID=UPI00221FC267|nr:uncharacterized protein BC939DRAFT_525931 [Gamsiella multidivaricata]KAI7829769.1 hypothetical protein BC939DRAFT_525931 [Gamsiella multidivaricata]
MDLEALAQGFFARFDFTNKSIAHDALRSSLIATGQEHLANETKTEEFKEWMTRHFNENKVAKRLSLQNVLKRHRTQRQKSGVIKKFSYDTIRNGSSSPCDGSIDKEERETALGATSILIPKSIPLRECRANFQPGTLRHLGSGNSLERWRHRHGPEELSPTLLSGARLADPAPDIYERWPTLGSICERVFVSNNYDEVAHVVRSESMHGPIAAYLFVIIMGWQHLQFHEEISENINEREGFSGLTRSFIQTPLTMKTKLLRMDFQGVFRLQQFDLLIISLSKHDFGNKMKTAVVGSLELAARLHQEIERRRQATVTLEYYDRVVLADALRLIEKTTSTPSKTTKRK